MLDIQRSWRPGRALVLIPLGLIIAVCAVDILAPPDIHLGPLLVVAPAITAAFAGPRLAALIGLLAITAQVVIGVARGVLATENLHAQIAALSLVSVMVVVFCLIRDRHADQLNQSRSIARTAQDVLLRPLPQRSGPLEIDSLYLAAEDQAVIGGDLFAAARTTTSTRLLIGDVRGKGLPAISHAALLLGAFRAAAHRQATLTNLAIHLDGAMRWDAGQWRTDPAPDTEESFATAILLDLPDDDPVVHTVTCGHPPPMILRDGQATPLPVNRPAPPLGLGGLPGAPEYSIETFTFRPGDLLLLYTDGVLEARDAAGRFYPLAERAAGWSAQPPRTLVRQLRDDLTRHVEGRIGDDVAAVAIRHRRP
ncbi:PP2C family protein-serine/threonine phosphatase [Streptomyces sp. NPDC002055]|uniref:PP2C family protein-serine/threonine phosphatase n=1 Tax=Streptomyces sp. NPDC002055 TaxID=3154534 RepID=UPI00331C232F